MLATHLFLTILLHFSFPSVPERISTGQPSRAVLHVSDVTPATGGDCTTGGGRPTAQGPAGPSRGVGVQAPGRGRTARLGDGSMWQRQKQGVKTTAGHQTHISPLRLPGETHSPGGLEDRHSFLTSGGWESEVKAKARRVVSRENPLLGLQAPGYLFAVSSHDGQTDRQRAGALWCLFLEGC